MTETTTEYALEAPFGYLSISEDRSIPEELVQWIPYSKLVQREVTRGDWEDAK